MFAYYVLVMLLVSICGPFLLLIRKTRAGAWQKLGLVPAGLQRISHNAESHQALGKRSGMLCEPPVWFHAVSVGEFNAIWPLVQALRCEHPNTPIAISTTTETGQRLAFERAGDWATIFYFPLDLPWAVSNWLKAINPRLVVIAETEIWPGFSWQCFRRNIPIMLVNGRMSPRSFAGYYRYRAFFGPVLRRYESIAVQSEAELERFRAVAQGRLPIFVTGNLKFDNLRPIEPQEREQLRQRLNLDANCQTIVAGSTHEGEEEALLRAFLQLSRDRGGQTLRLVLAPRHPERFNRVGQVIESKRLRVLRASAGEAFSGEDEVYLLDTIGQLFKYYAIADVAFVGGTLVPIGGHNLVEPLAYGLPVICGPHLDKVRDVSQELLSREALVVVKGKDELALKAGQLLADADWARTIGSNGNRWLAESQGALKRTVTLVNCLLVSDRCRQEELTPR